MPGATALVVLVASPGAGAATISTGTTADDFGAGASCSLREAVQSANTDAAFGGCPAGSGDDTILLAPGTYALSIPPDATPDDNHDGDLDLQDSTTTTFTGSFSGPVVIDGRGLDRIIHLTDISVHATVSGLILRNGVAPFGGAILATGSVLLINSTLTGNSASGAGGAIAAAGGGESGIVNSTLSGNTAGGDGGAVWAGVRVNLLHATLTNNVADANGDGAGDGGGIATTPGTVFTEDSIFAANVDRGGQAPDCGGMLAVFTHGGNVFGSELGCDIRNAVLPPNGTQPAGPGRSADSFGMPARLGPLADNGGLTPTHVLLKGSPALNRGVSTGITIDQRGVPRSDDPDSGAYERLGCRGVPVTIVGTPGTDTLTGTERADGIFGYSGNDVLKGGKGKDSLCGGPGRDKLKGGSGRDSLFGGKGRDILRGGKGRDILRGGKGRDTEKQ